MKTNDARTKQTLLLKKSDKMTRIDKHFFAEIAEILKTARNNTYRAVNSVMVETYWNIGKRIVEHEQDGKDRANYGDYLIENLSRYLTDIFGKGFSEANLQNMRRFYITFPEFPRQCLRNLSWSNVCLIMRLDDEDERNYYLNESANENWSVRTLERNIKSGYYRRLLSSKKTKRKTAPTVKSSKQNIEDFVKDPYVLEFLDIPEDLREKEALLESALLNNMQKFLLELGKGFSFVARQMRISTETDHFYLDMVFYNYILKCFVIIDLKTTKLTHADIGQMDMYVRMFDALKRNDDDNPTIGIILCADKSDTMVKYSFLSENKQIFTSKYKKVLPTEKELAEMIERENRYLLSDNAVNAVDAVDVYAKRRRK